MNYGVDASIAVLLCVPVLVALSSAFMGESRRRRPAGSAEILSNDAVSFTWYDIDVMWKYPDESYLI